MSLSLNSKLALPVALGLSLVTVTAVVAYYVFKKDEDSEGQSKTIKTSKVNVIEINVPKSIVPALIGRSGSNVKDIEKKSGALIHFKKFSDKEYDVCIIRGRSDAAQLAETLIHDFIKQQPNIIEDSIKVPGWACGRIIGTGGENINDISHRSGARVKVEGSNPGNKVTERQITFKGTKEQIEVARGLVENCVAQEKCRREIDQSKRAPRHVTPSQSPSPPAEHADKQTDEQETTGPSIEVYVSAVSSPSRFWVQFVGPQVSQLDELVAHMTEYYSKKENRDSHTLRHVQVGQVVAAVFRHDARWYRARVHDIRPNEFDASQQVADVFYLDYGDSEYVATHELCELRADLLRLRFQAMECFLAGVRPAAGTDGDRWDPHAVERFEELTQVARWKPLVSRTCTYKKTATCEGEKDKEIPGIKLFDVTEEGELDIGQALVSEGLAVPGPVTSPRPSPPRTPFGDLSNSKVLNMLAGERASSLPKDHKDDGTSFIANEISSAEQDGLSGSKSLASVLENSEKPASQPLSVSNFDLSYTEPVKPLNESQDFLHTERQQNFLEPETHRTPLLGKTIQDESKANINRIDSHHNLNAIEK